MADSRAQEVQGVFLSPCGAPHPNAIPAGAVSAGKVNQ